MNSFFSVVGLVACIAIVVFALIKWETASSDKQINSKQYRDVKKFEEEERLRDLLDD